MHEYKSLSHVRWECKYHLVIIPNYRRKVLLENLRRRVARILRELCEPRVVKLNEGNAQTDHFHICLSIPPKYSISHTNGFPKRKVRYVRPELARERRNATVGAGW